MKEAGYMAEILTLAGLQAGKNVIVDGSLRRAHWYREYFAYLREEFPELRIAIIHVTAPRDAVFRRAAVSASLDICLLFDFCLGLIAYLFFWRSRKEHS